MCSSSQGSAEKRGRAASSWKSCPCRRGEPAEQASVRQGTARPCCTGHSQRRWRHCLRDWRRRRPRETPAEPRVLGDSWETLSHEGRGLLRWAGCRECDVRTRHLPERGLGLGTGLRAGIWVWGRRERQQGLQLPHLNRVQSKAHGWNSPYVYIPYW